MAEKNQVVRKKSKKNYFLMIAVTVFIGYILRELSEDISDIILRYHLKKSHEEKLKSGYYDT